MLLDRIVAVMLSVLVMLYVPLIFTAQKQEQTIETYAGDAVDEFVNKACATGIITPTSYEELVRRLDATGVSYRIYLVHAKDIDEPTIELEEGVNKEQIGSYEEYYEEHRNQDILNTLFPDTPTTDYVYYYMEKGDFFKVVIENSSPTFAKRWKQLFSTNRSDTPSILVSRSGYVGDEVKN